MIWVCNTCQKSDPCQCGTEPALIKIKEVFDSVCHRMAITLPEENLLAKRSGQIHRIWVINYKFGVESNLEYIEFLIDRLVNPAEMIRIYTDGRIKYMQLETGENFWDEVDKAGLGDYSLPDEIPIYTIARDDLMSLWNDLVGKRKSIEGDAVNDITAGEILVLKKDGTLLKGLFERNAEFPSSAFILNDVTEKVNGKQSIERNTAFLVAYSEVDKIIVLN